MTSGRVPTATVIVQDGAHPSKTSQKYRLIVTPGRATSRSGRTGEPHQVAQVLLDDVAAGSQRQRQAAGEPRVDLVDGHAAVLGDEALHVGRTDQPDRLEREADDVG